MSDTSRRYEPNPQEVTAKVIDGEAIIINLNDGTYYSMDGVGAVLWEGIEGGASADALVALAVARFDTDEARAREDVAALLRHLVDEKIVREAAAGEASPDAVPFETGERAAYATPRLNRYDDMAELLALDPPTPGVLDNLMRDPEPGDVA